MSYTKGPWAVSHDGVVCSGEPKTAVEIAFVAQMSDDVPEANANGRLIAAAPELLEAVKDSICHSCLNRIGFDGPHVRDSSMPDRYDWRKCGACVIQRAAVKKAEGRS